MKFLVTGVGGQLGHDVMNELIKRGHEGIGSDIAPEYSGVKDNSAVTAAPYISLDITDNFSVNKVICVVGKQDSSLVLPPQNVHATDAIFASARYFAVFSKSSLQPLYPWLIITNGKHPFSSGLKK